MSSRAENWAWERDDVKGITKFVLVYLVRRAYYDDGAAAWPSVETIAFNCGCCERTVIRSLQELERKGYIRPGDQEMSARNPRTRKPIAKGHRSRVWDVVMDGDHPAENIEEKPRNLDALAEGDGKPDPMKDNLSPDGLSPEPKDVETRTNCPGILDRKSPNRQVINNSPLIPFGDAPLNAEQAATKPVADPKPEPVPATDWGKALPPRGCRNPLWVPEPGKLPEPVTERAGQEVRVLDGIRRRMLAVDQRFDVPATMADRKAVHSLLIDRPYGEIVATMDWAYRNRYWLPRLTSGARFAANYVQLRLEMLTHPDPTGKRAPDAPLPVVKDPNRAIPVSSSSASRVPIYGAALLRTSLCQEHIEGVISQEACPVCAYDKRNHATHDVAGRRKAKTGASAEAVVRPWAGTGSVLRRGRRPANAATSRNHGPTTCGRWSSSTVPATRRRSTRSPRPCANDARYAPNAWPTRPAADSNGACTAARCAPTGAGSRAWPKPTASPAGTAACRGRNAGGCSRTGYAPTGTCSTKPPARPAPNASNDACAHGAGRPIAPPRMSRQTIKHSNKQESKQSDKRTIKRPTDRVRMISGSRKGEERMRIAIANAKGGVAKTTSSIYIASVIVSRGGRAVVYDADPQSSASLWAAAAEQTADPLTFDVLPANQATLRQLAAGADPDEWAIIDAPPQGPTLDMAIKAADFVIVPASDSPMDLQQAWSTLDMARMSTPAALLLVKAERNTKAFRDTMDALNAMDTPRFDTIVPKAQSYKRSLGTNPHQLGEYRDLVTELQQIAGKQE